MKHYRCSLWLFLVISFFSLVGCNTIGQKPGFENASLPAAAVGAVAGAAAGAVVGGFIEKPLIGALVGGAFGAWVGAKYYQIPVLESKKKETYIQVVSLDDRLILLIPNNVLFRLNTSELKPDGDIVLKEAVSYLKKFPNDNIHISGNTDMTNEHYKIRYHIPLTLAQAKQVAGYLWVKGLDKGPAGRHLTYSGDEANHPIAANKKLSGRITNNRIQITVYPNKIGKHPISPNVPYSHVLDWHD